MEKTVQTLSQRYIELLSDIEAPVHPDSLQGYNLPPLFCEWIRCDLESRLDFDLKSPETEWSAITSEEVREQWSAFEAAAREAIRIPDGRLEEVIRSSVQRLLSLAVQPRKRIPELLFGPDDTVSPARLSERARRVLVHPHLAQAMVRYVERKGLKVLERGQCERVLVQVDDKLADRYNALDWVERLEPMFELTGEELPAELLRLFFEDKKRYKAARRFDLMKGGVTRTRLIETLSSPDLLEESDEEEPELFDTTSGPDSDEPGDLLNSRFMFDQPKLDVDEDKEGPRTGDSREEQRPIGFATEWEEKAKKTEPEESEKWLQWKEADWPGRTDSKEGSEENKAEEAGEENEPEDSLLEQKPSDVRRMGEDIEEKSGLADWYVQPGDDEKPEEKSGLAGWYAPDEDDDEAEQDKERGLAASFEQKNDEGADEDNVNLQDDEDDESTEEGTIWKLFLQEPEEEEPEAPAGLRLVDTLDRHQRLREWIGDDARRFQKKLFKGSETAFQAAVRDLAEQENWKDAADYIQNEIFAKQKVDMFEDAAVDFTDQLQEWYERLDDRPE